MKVTHPILALRLLSLHTERAETGSPSMMHVGPAYVRLAISTSHYRTDETPRLSRAKVWFEFIHTIVTSSLKSVYKNS